MFIDTHAHLDFKEFDGDREEVIKRAIGGGVEKIINVGCNLERSKAAVGLAEKYENIYASVGIHPHDVRKYDLDTASQELEKLAKSEKVVAVGECGLDYFRLEKGSFSTSPDVHRGSLEEEKKMQKEFFKAQVDLAKKLNLPLIIHYRDAFGDLLKIIQDTRYKILDTKFPGVTHCFSGNRQIAQEFLKLRFLISFTGSITYVRPQGELLQVVKEVPLDKIMIETDCPYLAPVPYRGKRNEPLYVKYIAQKIAEIKGVSLEEVEKATTENAEKLFGLK